jgi:hypothetical protein
MYSNFRLQAVGHLFDVDQYLSQYSIQYDRVWYRGTENYINSGFVKYLGDEFKLSSDKQEAIAIDYLQNNRDALKAVVRWENVQTVFLVICREIELDQSVVAVSLFFSSKLVTLAGDIGLDLSFYIRPRISLKYDVPYAEEW